jgi:hypothetical protein
MFLHIEFMIRYSSKESPLPVDLALLSLFKKWSASFLTTKLSTHVDCLLTIRWNKDLCKLLSLKKQNPQETQE